MLLSFGAGYYLDVRSELRRRREEFDPSPSVEHRFWAALAAEQVDEAYQLTSAAFRRRVAREQFAALARQFAEYLARPSLHGAGSSSSYGSDGGSRAEYKNDSEGKRFGVTVTSRREEDSLLYLRPPPLRVDEFTVGELPESSGPLTPFGRKRPFGDWP